MKSSMSIETFFDPQTYTLTYVVYDPSTLDAVVIDPVLDYEPCGSRVSATSVTRVREFLQQHGLRLHFILETHAHADHLSGSQVLRRDFPGAVVAIGARITEVQTTFRGLLDLKELAVDGRQFDRLLAAGERVSAGSLEIEVIATPGHTPACVSYHIDDAVFTGDALFMPDYGTGRCDFPRGSAHDLYHSVTERLYRLPPATRVFVGHDYQPGGRPLAFESTIAAEMADNIQLPASRSEDEFVQFRNKRDAGLAAPVLLYPSIQVNIDGGHLPAPNASGKVFLQVPVHVDPDAVV